MGPLARLPSLRSIPFAKRRRPVYDSPDSGQGEECRGGGGNRRRHHLRQGCGGPQNARVLRGEGGFQEGVSAYLRRFEYSNARGEDFWEALGKTSGLPVSRIARAWITKAGFPVVGVTTS